VIQLDPINDDFIEWKFRELIKMIKTIDFVRARAKNTYYVDTKDDIHVFGIFFGWRADGSSHEVVLLICHVCSGVLKSLIK
jgi:hypothetical protein